MVEEVLVQMMAAAATKNRRELRDSRRRWCRMAQQIVSIEALPSHLFFAFSCSGRRAEEHQTERQTIMADTSIFEVARATHEEIERYEQAIVDLLLSSSSTSASAATAGGHKEQLKQEHKTSELLDRIIARKQFLRELYDDKEGERAKERELLSTIQSADQGSLAEFYRRLDKVKDYHKKYPQNAPEAFVVDFSSLEASSGLPDQDGLGAATTSAAGIGGLDFIDRMFSGEEASGRFLDLYVQHDQFMNLKGVRRLPYVTFLDEFDNFSGETSRIPTDTKKTEAYRKYLLSLRSYLSTFLRKVRPLSDVDSIQEQALASFEEDWTAGRVEGWGSKDASASAAKTAPAEGQGIWCEACKRFYSKQTVFDAHLKSPKHLKAAERLKTAGSAAPAPEGGKGKETNGAEQHGHQQQHQEEKQKTVAKLELAIRAYGKELDQVRQETKANVERKAALTDRERQMEAEAAEAAATDPEAAAAAARAEAEAADDGDADERIYNPLKLPLGWDGKPIPYWLYKLHGLGVEYKCEICSDYVYQGRKNFEKHFQESRHAFGMRALGLPNTKHFYEITKIADALACECAQARQVCQGVTVDG